ncbi:MAG: glycosyltransferase family A protein [Bacteroidota bacterium]
MNFAIIIPAHNESDYIGQTLESLVNQSHQPHQIIVVNDNSTDNTATIVKSYSDKYQWIKLLNKVSSDIHMPGSKIIQAFNYGLDKVKPDFDLLCKFDADLIFPSNYLELISTHFRSNPKLGMAAGFCYIEKDGRWVLENLTRKDHIRGALKCYRKSCFQDIGGLKAAMGWDTLDELLASYFNWQILTDETLEVKHLKQTGESYNVKAKLLQGEAMYRMRYGFMITAISGLKLALKKKKLRLFLDYMKGYSKAKSSNKDFLVDEDQGRFIRNKRWKGIKKKFF